MKALHIPSIAPACKCGVDPVGEKRTRNLDGHNEVKHIGLCPKCGLVLYSTEWYRIIERDRVMP